MLALAFVVVVVVAALLFYVVRTMKPKRLKLSGGLWKVLTFNFEADGGDNDLPKELRPGSGDQERA